MKNVNFLTKTMMNGVRGEEKAPEAPKAPKAQGCGAITPDVASRTDREWAENGPTMVRVLSRIDSTMTRQWPDNGPTTSRVWRYVAMLLMVLTLGMGEMWGANYILGPDGSWTQNTAHELVSSGITNWQYKNLTPSGQWTNFKILKGSTWYGKDSGGNNVTVGTLYTPTTTGGNAYCDFTTNYSNMSYYFFFNTSTNKLMIQPNYYLAGTCGASNQSWGQTQNATTYDATNGYFKWNTCSLTANTEYAFKLCGYNAWTYQYGDRSGVTVTQGTKTSNNSGDIKFKPTYGGTAVIVFVPTDNTMVIHCPYQITYNKGANGSGSIASGSKTWNTSFTLSSSKFTRTGYTQDGWSTSDGGDKVYNLGASYTTNADLTLYPHWVENKYTVTINNDGHGSTSPSGAQSNVGQVTGIAVSATPDANYEFVNWTITSGSGSFASAVTTASNTFMPTAAATIQANFRSTATISLTVARGAHVTTVSGSQDPVTLGSSYSISATAFETGYEFNNWTASPNANASFTSSTSATTTVTVSNGSVTVTANAKPTTYSITYAGMDGATNFDGAPSSYTVESSTIVLGTPTKAHYHFAGWTLSGSPITQITAGSTGNKTLTATWTALPKVYLKNTMNWANAYVTFYRGEYWDASNGAGSSNSSPQYVADPAAMTYNSSTGLFEYECPDVAAFLSKTYRYAAFTKDKQDNYGNFWSTEAIYFNNNFRYDSVAVVAAQTSALMNSETVKYYTTKTNGNLEYVTLAAGSGTGWFFPGGWSSWETKGNEGEWNSTNIRWTKSLSANTSYGFKIYNQGVFYGNSGTYSASGSKTFTDGGSNCTLSTTLAGTYTFDFDVSTKSLTISYPAVYAVSGSFNSWTQETNLAFTGDDGTYSVTINGSGTNYEFKVLNNAIWYGHSDKTFTGTESNVTLATGSNNIKLKADVYPNGSYTFAYNKSTNKLGVTYPNSYNVTFGQSTGGEATTATANSTSITSNKKIISGANVVFTKGSTSTGYNFKGWYANTSGTGDKLVDGTPNTYTINPLGAAATVYAVYTPQVYTITYKDKGGGAYSGSNSGSLPGTHTYGTATALVNGVKTGYTFNGWYTDSDCTVSAGSSIGASAKTANFTLYAKWTVNNYTITLHEQGATTHGTPGDGGTITVTYDATTNLSKITAVPERTGYTFGGYYDTEECDGTWIIKTDTYFYWDGTYINGTTGKWQYDGNLDLYAKWVANQYTVTLDVDEANKGTTTGATTSQDIYYDDATVTVPNRPTAANGYALDGYYTDHDGEGLKVINGDGTWIASVTGYTDANKKWIHADDVTLYAYYKKAEITSLVATPAVIAPSETITITPTIAPTPAGTVAVCYELQYSNGTPLPSQPSWVYDGYAVSFAVPAARATYRVQAKLCLNNCSGTVLDTEVASFQVAGEHTVTIQYKCGDMTIKESSEMIARPLAWSDVIEAPAITGYTFSGWEAGDGVTITDDGSTATTTTTESDIQVKANYDGTLTAVYNKKRMIYFYNTLGWSSVHVYFYKNSSYWSGETPCRGSGSKTNYTFTDTPYSEGLNGTMTQYEGTNIWYFDAEAAGVPETYPTVVFTEADQNNYEYFYNTKAVKRDDYNSTTLPMFVPLSGQTPETYNGTAYYFKGYWMNYPENTGYTLRIYNSEGANNGTDYTREIAFPYSADKMMPLKVDVEFNDANHHEYWFIIHRNDNTYSGVNYTFNQDYNDEQALMSNSTKGKIVTSAPGNYTFTLSCHENNLGYVYYYIDIDFPIAKNDYRIYYSDNATWSKGAHTKDSWNHPSDVITKINGEATEAKTDIVSFYIAKGEGISHTMKFQYASAINETNGAITWSDVSGGTIDLSAYSSVITKAGVYNFYIKQPIEGGIEVEKVEPYTGNYYIRTDCAGSTKWDSYKALDHQMTYSEYTEENWNYSHYYCHWVENNNNIKFVIANDYSPCISDTLAEDYGTAIANITAEGNSGAGNLNSASANIRFMWNQVTNKLSRAYIGGSTFIADRFLVLEGDSKMFDENGNALTNATSNRDHRTEIHDGVPGTYYIDQDNQVILNDDENFVYERTIQVQPAATGKLTAKYNDKVQYFIGSSTETVELLGGESESKYTMRIIYDFKTNRLVTAYIPSGTITEPLAIHADIMLVREHQEAGQQLTFSGEGAALSDVKTVYGVMRFNRWTLNNKSITPPHGVVADPRSSYERGLYWISFPFDVNLSDVFGFGTYGTDWIIMEYDGAERAAKGFWADSEGFWKYIFDRRGIVLEAGKGYVLALDLDLMKDDNTSFWANNIEQVELFFPSAHNISNIKAIDATINVPEHECKIGPRFEGGDDRTIKDSHWNIIGVPSFANYSGELTDDEGNEVEWNVNPTTDQLPFLYEWNMVDNTYTVKSGTTYPFKTMHGYYVQYAGELNWALASATYSQAAPRRTYNKANQNVEFRLELQQNDKMTDQTFIRMTNDESVTANFDFNKDLGKELSKSKANIYTMVEGYIQTAGNCLPMTEQTTVIPVGVKIAANDNYTFTIPDGTDGVGVTLIDTETDIRTNLSAIDYTVALEAGTYDNRFVLEVSPIQHVATDLENTASGNANRQSDVRKLLIDGLLYIVRDGKMFDARGARIQ